MRFIFCKVSFSHRLVEYLGIRKWLKDEERCCRHLRFNGIIDCHPHFFFGLIQKSYHIESAYRNPSTVGVFDDFLRLIKIELLLHSLLDSG